MPQESTQLLNDIEMFHSDNDVSSDEVIDLTQEDTMALD